MSRIVVIGAGPGGATVAWALARAGFAVIIAEAREFPRAKVCGEFISPAVSSLLEAIVPVPHLRAAGARRVDTFTLRSGSWSQRWRLPCPAWSLGRGTLDALLLSRARDAGADVLQPASVRSVAYAADRACALLADGRAIECDAVIHADASGRHDPAGPVAVDDSLIGLKCHLAPGAVDTHAVDMRACAGAYLGTIEIERGRGTCALVARKSLLARAAGDTDRLVARLWPQFRPAWRDGDWLACGIPRSPYIPPGHLRSLRVGNAAAAVDPVGGEGIGLAIWSGWTTAHLLARHAPHVGPLTHAALIATQRELARLYRDRLRSRLPACRWAAALLMRPVAAAGARAIVRLPAVGLGAWYRATGKAGKPVRATAAPARA